MINNMVKETTSSLIVESEKDMILTCTISDETEDRDGDIIKVGGWEFSNYLNNPIVLKFHDSRHEPIGKCLELTITKNSLRATWQAAPTQEGESIFKLYRDGFMSAYSVGFRPIKYRAIDENDPWAEWFGPFIFEEQELLEFSTVTIPANPNALNDKNFLSLAKDAGILGKVKEGSTIAGLLKTYSSKYFEIKRNS